MSHIIYCVKLQQEAEGLETAPYPGALGQKILQQISKQAWQMWLNHQTMLINEYRLSLIDPKAREFLVKEMEKFLFGEGSAKPEGYTPSV
jgi:Fe-S cluster biosynthesis and repair protein YggX